MPKLSELFIETPFVSELVSWLDRTRTERCYRLIGAAPGAGKTRIGSYYLAQHGRGHGDNGQITRPVIRFLTPNEKRRQGAGVRERLADQMGAVISRGVQYSATWIARQLIRFETELLIVGDAHRMTPDEHLPALQEISDLYEEGCNQRLGIAFLSATTRGNVLLESRISAGDDPEWAQIRRRFAPIDAFVSLPGLSLSDVRLVLHAYDTAFAQSLPSLRLVRWAAAINQYLVRPRLSPEGPRHVPMASLCTFVGQTVQLVIARGLHDIDADGDLIAEVGESLIRGRPVTPARARDDVSGDESIAAR